MYCPSCSKVRQFNLKRCAVVLEKLPEAVMEHAKKQSNSDLQLPTEKTGNASFEQESEAKEKDKEDSFKETKLQDLEVYKVLDETGECAEDFLPDDFCAFCLSKFEKRLTICKCNKTLKSVALNTVNKNKKMKLEEMEISFSAKNPVDTVKDFDASSKNVQYSTKHEDDYKCFKTSCEMEFSVEKKEADDIFEAMPNKVEFDDSVQHFDDSCNNKKYSTKYEDDLTKYEDDSTKYCIETPCEMENYGLLWTGRLNLQHKCALVEFRFIRGEINFSREVMKILPINYSVRIKHKVHLDEVLLKKITTSCVASRYFNCFVVMPLNVKMEINEFQSIVFEMREKKIGGCIERRYKLSTEKKGRNFHFLFLPTEDYSHLFLSKDDQEILLSSRLSLLVITIALNLSVCSRFMIKQHPCVTEDV